MLPFRAQSSLQKPFRPYSRLFWLVVYVSASYQLQVQMEDFDLIDEFEEDLGLLESDFNDSSSSEDEDIRHARLSKLKAFYSQRQKLFELFDDEKLRKTFRFDRPSIMYITGTTIINDPYGS